jgi:hypothetical protein
MFHLLLSCTGEVVRDTLCVEDVLLVKDRPLIDGVLHGEEELLDVALQTTVVAIDLIVKTWLHHPEDALGIHGVGVWFREQKNRQIRMVRSDTKC